MQDRERPISQAEVVVLALVIGGAVFGIGVLDASDPVHTVGSFFVGAACACAVLLWGAWLRYRQGRE